MTESHNGVNLSDNDVFHRATDNLNLQGTGWWMTTKRANCPRNSPRKAVNSACPFVPEPIWSQVSLSWVQSHCDYLSCHIMTVAKGTFIFFMCLFLTGNKLSGHLAPAIVWNRLWVEFHETLKFLSFFMESQFLSGKWFNLIHSGELQNTKPTVWLELSHRMKTFVVF